MRTNNFLKRLVALGLGLVLGASVLSAQNLTVKGTVLDANKEPVIGAGVMQVGTTNGAACDIDGKFTITVPAGAELEITAIGYETLRVKANSSTLNITLQEESTELEETVVVGYGTQKKASLTSSITNIQAEDITSTKQSDLVSSLQGKVPGLQIRQNSGAVGWFDQDISIRGFGAPLVIIDGVARQSKSRQYWGWVQNNESSSAALAELNPDDIESITVLKDASASIYGLGAQNGVILVTTKKGQIGKPTVNYSNTLTFGVPTALPKEVDIATYMEVYNEMTRNNYLNPSVTYSDEEIAKYRNHEPGYENFSWWDAIFKKYTFSHVHNVSLRGGNQQTTYYLSANYTNQDAIYRANTGDYNRVGFTANFSTKITPNLTASFQSAINVTTQEMPPANTTQNAMYYALLTPRMVHATTRDNPNHYSSNVAENRNAVALMESSVAGSMKDNDVSFRNNLDVKYEAPFLKGLVLTASGAYDVVERKNSSLTRHFPLYDYESDILAAYNPDKNQYSENWNTYTRYYGRLQANYNTTIARSHHLGATLAAEANLSKIRSISASREYGDFYTHDIISQGTQDTQTNGGSRSSRATAGYVGRINYDYQGKYLVEVMARYDGTYLYAPGHRWGFFPSYSLGWRLSEEKFFKAILPQINNLKFRWSDGMTGYSQGDPYGYLVGFSTNGSTVFNDGAAISGYANHSPAQTIISWAKVRMMDFGFDFEVWRGLLGGTVDWFWRNTSGIAAASTATVPDMYGQSLPQENLNKSQNVGIDLSLYHRNHIKDFNYRVMFTATFSRSRNTYTASMVDYPWASSAQYYASNSVGRWSNAHSASMYHWQKGNPQFTGWEDINNSKEYYGNMKAMLPGMYKIEDRNQDGVIDANDMYYTWSETNPPLQFGLVLSGSWKGLDFNATFNAATLVSKSVSLSGGMGYGFFTTFYENYMDRWHTTDPKADPFDPNTQWTAGYWPALAIATSAYDDSSNLTYRKNQPYDYVDGTYLRLKSLEIGYTFQAKLLQKAHIRSLRVYVNGTNLLTFCNPLLKPYDPERNQNSYLGVAGTPLMKNFSAGININF
ncbi:MAG: TonB-dependent receptor [Bacteroidales bacterium]|nr:TonB-dependent receptor [Bacteroidales bacterium]